MKKELTEERLLDMTKEMDEILRGVTTRRRTTSDRRPSSPRGEAHR